MLDVTNPLQRFRGLLAAALFGGLLLACDAEESAPPVAVTDTPVAVAATAATPLPPTPTPPPSWAQSEAALAAIPGHAIGERERAAYREAAAARDAGQHLVAAEAFARIRAEGGPLASLAGLRQAEALVLAKRHADAVAVFIAAAHDDELPATLRVSASMGGAHAAIEAQRPHDAVALLAQVGREVLATTTETANARALAGKTLQRLGDANWSAESLAAIEANAGAKSAVEALDLLEAQRVAVPPLTAALVRYRARENTRATALYRAALATELSDTQRAEAWFYLGALHERANERGAALDAYARSLAAAPNGRLAPDAHWWRGSLLEQAGATREATAEYDTLVARFPRSQYAREAALHAALATSDAGDRGDAARRLREIVSTRPPAEGARAARWLRLLGLHAPGDPAPADLDPFALPSLLDAAGPRATEALPGAAYQEWDATPGDWAEADAWMRARHGEPSPAVAELRADPALRLAVAIGAVGEHDAARAILAALMSRYAGKPYESLLLGRAAGEAGFADIGITGAMRVLSSLTPHERLQAPRAIARLAYPTAYPEAVTAASEAEAVPPLLLLALVRQESYFRATAGSSAGAMGLTQVIEPTARTIASALGTEYRQELLHDPATSLRFGAYYLGQQLEAFNGDVLAALAAYNAGPGAARTWLRTQRTPGADGYITAVEYAETRLYLELVLENYAAYRYFYGATEAPAIR